MATDSRLAAALAALDAARGIVALALDEGGADLDSTPLPLPALVLKFDEAARELGVSRTAVFDLVKRGELAAVEIPGAGRRIRRCDLEAYVERLAPA